MSLGLWADGLTSLFRHLSCKGSYFPANGEEHSRFFNKVLRKEHRHEMSEQKSPNHPLLNIEENRSDFCFKLSKRPACFGAYL